ncbi:MAG: hypothetical protein ABIY55_17935, partial [Kofleriaceae bacterium]
HFDTEDLDYDAYTFEVGADWVGTLTLTGPGARDALTLFDASIIDGTDHGVANAKVDHPDNLQLSAGTYEIQVRAQNPTAITTSYPYTIELARAVGAAAAEAVPHA